MLGYEDLQRCLDFVTEHSARAMSLGDRYGIAVGRPANLLILDADSDYEVVRTQAKVRVSPVPEGHHAARARTHHLS